MPTLQHYRIRDLDNTVHHLSVSKKEAGLSCLVQVCSRLNILEKDYFGLKYVDKHGEQLWANLRNPLHEQLAVDEKGELELAVKFFVKPRKLLQPLTRRCFYLQLKALFLSGGCQGVERGAKMAAHILQAEFGDYCSQSHEEYLRCVMQVVTGTNPVSFQSVLDEHKQLQGVDRGSTVQQFLDIAHESDDYGLERHSVLDRKGVPMTVSVGPSAIFIINATTQVKTKFGYSLINCTTHSGKRFEISFSSQANGPPQKFSFFLRSKASSLALYRAVTEFHTFFCRETVSMSVKSAGYHTSFFSALKHSDVDRYYFDVLKTHKEVLEVVWPSVQGGGGGEERQVRAVYEGSPDRLPAGDRERVRRAASMDTDARILTCYDCSEPVVTETNSRSSPFNRLGQPPHPPPNYSELDPLVNPGLGTQNRSATTCNTVESCTVANVLSKARELEEELHKIKRLMTCRVCETNPISATFCPCGHAVCCMDCAESFQQARCLQCSTQVQAVQRILLS